MSRKVKVKKVGLERRARLANRGVGHIFGRRHELLEH